MLGCGGSQADGATTSSGASGSPPHRSDSVADGQADAPAPQRPLAVSGPSPPPPGGEPDGWRQSRRLLAGPLRPLVAGQMLGQAADGLAQIAFAQVVLFEAGRGATPWELTKLLAVTLLPFSLVGPFAGLVIDRWDRRRVMVVVSIARAVLVLAAIGPLVARSQAAAYVGVVLLLSSSRFVLAAKGAALPRTVAAGDLVTANALSAIGGMSAAFAGAVAGAAFVGAAPGVAFVLAAAGYGLAAARFGRLPAVGGGETVPLAAGLRRVAGELRDELRTVALVADVRRPLVAVWAHRLLLGAGFLLLVLVADERFGLEVSGYGVALAATGVAAFAGTLAAPLLARRFDPAGLLPVAFALAGLAALAVGLVHEPPMAVIVAGVAAVGFAFQALKVLVDALVQRASPDVVRGRVFSAYDVLYNVAFVAAGLALVPLWQPDREGLLLRWLAVGFVVAGLLVARSARTWPFGAARARPARGRRRWPARAAAYLGGGLPTLAFPEPSLWLLGFLGPVPALVLVARASTAREAAVRAWLAGGGFFLAAHHWLVPNVGPAALPLGLLLGVLWVPWGWAVWATLRPGRSAWQLAAGVVLVPAAWVAAEHVRSWEALGGPWALLGASQWQNRPVLALAALGGVWLVSFALAAVATAAAAAVVDGTLGRRTAALLAAGALTLGSFAYGAYRPDPPHVGVLRVAGVQPGVIHPPGPRFEASEQATMALVGTPLDLVVWGESSVGFDPARRPDLMARVAAASRAVGADVLVNVDARRGPGGIFKSSVLIGPDGPRGRYDKMRLVPFGEYIPLRGALGWLHLISDAAEEDRRRGDRLLLLDSGGVRLGPLVCFESAFADLGRGLAAMGADVLVVQSATSTFQGSWAPEQHASLAALRAVETGRPVVHATLTGTSAAFDATGRRLAWFGTDRTGSWQADVPLTTGTTLYVRLGDWVPALCLLTLLAAAVTGGMRAARLPTGEQR